MLCLPFPPQAILPFTVRFEACIETYGDALLPGEALATVAPPLEYAVSVPFPPQPRLAQVNEQFSIMTLAPVAVLPPFGHAILFAERTLSSDSPLIKTSVSAPPFAMMLSSTFVPRKRIVTSVPSSTVRSAESFI